MHPPDPQHPKIRIDPDGALWLNFGEYGREVEVAAFSADGSRLLTVQEVGVARVWDVATGERVGEIRPASPLEGSEAAPGTRDPFQVFIEAAALSPGGELALLGLNDGTAGVFRVADGARLSVMHDPAEPPASGWSVVRAVRFSPDGERALAGFISGGVGIWDPTGERRIEFLKPDGEATEPERNTVRGSLVSSVDLSADGRYLFAGTSNLIPWVWDLETRQLQFTSQEHRDPVIRLRLEGESALWATQDGAAWSAEPGQVPVKRLDTGEFWAEVAFSPDGREWLARTGTEIRRWCIHGEAETLLSLGSVGNWADEPVTLGFDRTGSLCFYPASRSTLVLDSGSSRVWFDCVPAAPARLSEPGIPDFLKARLEQNLTSRFMQAELSPAGDVLATRAYSPDVRLWSVPSGELLGVLEHPENAYALAFSPDGSLLAVSLVHHINEERPYEIHLWSVREQRLVARLSGHRHFIYRMEFGPGNAWLVSTSQDRTVRVWDLDAGGRQRAEIEHDDLDTRQVRVLSDGRLLVFRRTVLEVHAEFGQPLLSIPIPDLWKRAWALSGDERTIACSGPWGKVLVWSLEDGALLQTYSAPIHYPRDVPGELAEEVRATAGGLLWEAPGGPYLHQGDGPRGWVSPLALSPDRRETVVPGQAEAALVSLETPLRIVERFPFEGRLRAGCIRPDRVLLVNSAGKLFVHSR